MERAAQNRRDAFLIAATIFALAFAVRAVFAFQWQATPYGAAPLLDARAYDDWAQAIADGHFFRARAFYQSPLYPYLLAALYSLFGRDYLLASLLNGLIDAGTAAVLTRVAFSLFGRAAAILTGLLAAFCAPMIFYTAPLMKEPLALFLLALFLLASLRAIEEGQRRDYALAGFCLGLTALARGNVILLAPPVLVIIFMHRRRAALVPSLLFLIALLAAIAPAAIHNFVVAHDFVPLTYADGFNLYIGHSPTANGSNAYPPEVSTDPAQEEIATTWAAARAAGHPLPPSQVADYWRKKAFIYALHNPAREAELLGRKLLAFMNGGASFDNYDPTFIRRNFSTLFDLPLPGFALIIVLAAFGFVGGVRLHPRGTKFLAACAALYMLSVVIFYVTDRYRLPVLVFLLPLAGAALPSAIVLWHARDMKWLALSTIASLTFLILAVVPLARPDLAAFDWGTLTAIYADRGDAANAIAAFGEGSTISPTGVGAQAYVRAAEMAEKAGQPRDAARLIEQMAALFPDDGVAQYNLGRLQAMRGDLPAARWSFETARKLTPTYGLTYYALAKIYARMGDRTAAQKAIADGLAINPEDERLRGLKVE